MTKIRFLFKTLNLLDIYTVIMLIIYSVLYLALWTKINFAAQGLIINICLIALIFIVANRTDKNELKGFKLLFRKAYLMPIAYYVYYHIFDFIKVINPHDYDYLLSHWDYAILGFDITKELHKISFPLLTEYLQVTYFLFFFYPLFIGAELIIKKEYKQLTEYAQTIIFGFYLSYLLYLMFPAVGPRFYSHNFTQISNELPGIFITDILRDIVNSGGGIKDKLIDPLLQVNRDCFPSGHTMMTLMSIILAFKYKTKIRFAVLVLGCSLIFSTLYLRYHYFVDVLSGIFFCIITIILEPKLSKFIELKLNEK